MSYTANYPSPTDATTVKTTTEYDATHSGYMCVKATAWDGNWNSSNAWLAANGVSTNQRFNIDLGSALIIRQVGNIGLANGGGSSKENTANNFTLWGSNSSSDFDETAYAEDGTWTQIGGAFQFVLPDDDSDFTEHTQTIDNTVAYRYYCFKIADNYGQYYFGMGRLRVYTEDGYTPPTGSSRNPARNRILFLG